ncbi:10629_t:CDS:1, partial [Cetraspora pellucida]
YQEILEDFIDYNNSLNYFEILDNSDSDSNNKAFDIDLLKFFNSDKNENILLSKNSDNSLFSEI